MTVQPSADVKIMDILARSMNDDDDLLFCAYTDVYLCIKYLHIKSLVPFIGLSKQHCASWSYKVLGWVCGV